MTDIKTWRCWTSLTIFWARLQMLAGAALLALASGVEIAEAANVQSVLPPKWSGIALFVMGCVTEAARRRKEWQK